MSLAAIVVQNHTEFFVPYLNVESLAILLSVSKTIRKRAPYLITEWSNLTTSDKQLRTNLFDLYEKDTLTCDILRHIPIYYQCETLLSILSSYALSQTGYLRHSKKEICKMIAGKNLLDTLPMVAICPFVPKNVIVKPFAMGDGEHTEHLLTKNGSKATPLAIMYELFLEGYCVWFENWSSANFYSNMLLKKMSPNTVEWTLEKCVMHNVINTMQAETIKINIANTIM